MLSALSEVECIDLDALWTTLCTRMFSTPQATRENDAEKTALNACVDPA